MNKTLNLNLKYRPRNIKLFICLLSFIIISTVSTTYAYELAGYSWPQPSATFYVDIQGENGLWNEAFEDAMYEWGVNTIFQYDIVRGTYSNPCSSFDDRNGVSFESTNCGDSWGSTTLAITLTWYSRSTITETDIVFNSNESWDVYSGPWLYSVADFSRVAVHELGHALGLDHEDSGVSNIMASYAGDNTIPQQDDINGVEAIYGGGTIYYRDYDEDGYGNPDNSTESSSRPSGYVTDKTDCDDYDNSIHPGATEIRGDGIDQDCDGSDLPSLNTYYRDYDEDNYGNPDDSTQSASQPSGYVDNNTDCDDNDSTINPGATEIKDDGIDQDCNGSDLEETNEPIAATLVSPDNIASYPIIFIWNAVSNSTWYYLWVNDSTGNMITKWYTSKEADCESGTGNCSVTPLITLSAGNATWWVQTWNKKDYGEWSDRMDFTVNTDNTNNTLAKATLISPLETITDTTPIYTWNAVLNSTWYYLWVNDSTGAVIKKWYTSKEADCKSGTGNCSVTPLTTLSAGNATWWIQTWNNQDYGEWSDRMDVTVSD